MRKTLHTAARSAMVTMLAVLAAVVLAITSTITSAVSLAAIALIVPGTGTPNPNNSPNFMQNAVNYYIQPLDPACKTVCTPEPVPYIAQFWPFPFAGWGGLNGAKWNVSVASGVQSLNEQITTANAADPGGDIVIFGYSQGATVSNLVKRQLADANGGVIPSRYSFVFIGDPNRPNGGLFERLAMLGTVPILDATFGQPAPTDTTVLPAVNTTDIAFQYDGVADFPANPLNILADLNAIAGFWYIHGTYLSPKGSDPSTALPYGYTIDELKAATDCSQSPKNCQTYNDTLYITIPNKVLPIMQPLLEFGAATGTTAIIKPFVDLISPVTRVLIETGYDRSNYGQPTPFTIFTPINPVKLTVDLATAAVQGIHDALGDLGVAVPAAPSVPAPAPASTLAAATTSAPAVETKTVADIAPKALQRKASPKPSLVAKSEKPKTGDDAKSIDKPAKSGTGKSGKPTAARAAGQAGSAKDAA
ncbi:PE-PPE domain-containing protein [Mycolicibacterium sp. P1-5]|uniref:PE-PPE domain-containing protein n=1 Tax=Mycolicibacterium sp. P1-5 TaxID=2024617 RepID=UPI0011F02A26|nr:PE-PPE domain-containing protein [Mycolicibacterium sp. P1-5]KAA0112135.1 PE-PPE domain-containing protein [Mycolicibacterium sp. P1-5]